MPDRTRGAGTGSTPQVDPTTTRTRKRFARRQWARRWLAWRYVVAALLAIALVVGTVWLVFFSSVLAVQGVEVDGAQTLSEQEIRNVAAVPSGEPLARVDLDGVRARLEAMAVVRAAEVTRQWPDEVLIQVEERVPIAVVEIGGRIRGLDADGVVFRDYPSAPADLPRVRTSTGTGSDALREAAQVVAALPAALSRRVSYVEVATVDQISLVLRDDRRVVWGSAEESAEKARVLTQLLKQPARTYDVSVPGQPATSGG